MGRQTLETALRAARQKQKSKSTEVLKASNVLVLALRSSATDMDKIVQRRVEEFKVSNGGSK